MKIWFDTTPLNSIQRSNGGRDYSDCDCDCGDCGLYDNSFSAHKTASGRLIIGGDKLAALSLKKLQQASTLHLQECSNQTWLACNPIGAGTVAVLDTRAHALLEQFRSPTMLASLLAEDQASSEQSIEDAARFFYHAGLINDIAQPIRKTQEQTPQVLQAWLHVTNACNLSCNYCYVQKNKESMSEDVSQRSVEAIFRSALKQHFTGVRIKYAGGEASLAWQHVLATHSYASQLARQHELDFSAYIITNGVRLPQRMIEQFKEHEIGITISLDGIDEYHDAQRPFASGLGSFKYVDRTITQMLASGFIPHINVTVSQRNLAGIPALVSYILARDMPFFLFRLK